MLIIGKTQKEKIAVNEKVDCSLMNKSQVKFRGQKYEKSI